MYRITIGLELHVCVNTKTKLFSRAPLMTNALPNTNVSIVDNGMPGALPCLNKQAVLKSIKTALALNMTINKIISFDRKHYSYPDLPLGYQITQMRHPIGINGIIHLPSGPVKLNRLALEADAGKNIHIQNHSYVDLNRCGSPLMEIITEPDIHSIEQVLELIDKIQNTVRYLDSSDANMEKGQLRADINISLSKTNTLGTRVEIKNINSKVSAKQALEYEITRQSTLLDLQQPVIMETRGFNVNTGETFTMRTKETEIDYRYIPEYDIPPTIISQELIDQLTHDLPELSDIKQQRWITQYNLSEQQAITLTHTPDIALYYETSINHILTDSTINNDHKPTIIKTIATLMLADFAALLNRDTAEQHKNHESTTSIITYQSSKITPLALAQLATYIVRQDISSKQAKQVIELMYTTGDSPQQIIKNHNMQQISDPVILTTIVQDILVQHPQEVQKYRAGQSGLLSFFTGKAMSATKGQANPTLLNQIITTELQK